MDIREYGMRFTGWWKNLQPSWRTTGAHALSDMRDVPKNETWQSLRKGGTAGIYVVLMGLSWWILAQSEMPDATAWLIVDDLSWVVQQMTDNSSRGPKQLSAKRSRDREEDDSDTRRRKRCVLRSFFITTSHHNYFIPSADVHLPSEAPILFIFI